MATLDTTPKSSPAMSDTVARSIPTMDPTKPLSTTSSANCRQFARSPRWIGREVDRTTELEADVAVGLHDHLRVDRWRQGFRFDSGEVALGDATGLSAALSDVDLDS
jgi:hypothetical protein